VLIAQPNEGDHMAQKVKPIPDGYHSITPYLYVKGGAKALEFYATALGAQELFRMPTPDGKIGHAEMKIGDSVFMLADEMPAMGIKSPGTLGGNGSSLMIYVPDVDAAYKRAIGAGAEEVRPLKNQFYGDRSGMIADPFGHQWTLATHVEDVPPDELDRRAAEEMAKHNKFAEAKV
jgi:PhnB protein